ncbi:MAG: stealth family protein [Candidatus Gastranaerophilales bacterium]|nr:stealth family protein [Candidatus Gastranaerophilales bacterium]
MEQIDFVVTWVDGADEAWQREKANYAQADGEDDRRERYRDWGLLRYWFRGVERYAPWVRKIHFVTWGHLPRWLYEAHPKLHIVRHEDYIPKAYLPTFNSNVLEIYLHQIEGLSERFVYFNDDMFLIDKVKPEYFFRGGKPRDMLALQAVVANPSNPVMSRLYLNNSMALAVHFDKRENMRRQPGSYFNLGYPPVRFWYNVLERAFPLYTGFYTVHGPSPFCRSTFEEVWRQEGEILRGMSGNRFRSGGDVTQYLFREWQKLSGNFHPGNIERDVGYFEIGAENRKLLRAVEKQKRRILCVNDTWQEESGDFRRVQAQLQGSFERLFPTPSEFERG